MNDSLVREPVIVILRMLRDARMSAMRAAAAALRQHDGRQLWAVLSVANVSNARFSPVHESRSIGQRGLNAAIRCGLHERLLWVKAPRQEREPAYRPAVRGAALRVVYRQEDWDLNRRYPYPLFSAGLSENGRGRRVSGKASTKFFMRGVGLSLQSDARDRWGEPLSCIANSNIWSVSNFVVFAADETLLP